MLHKSKNITCTFLLRKQNDYGFKAVYLMKTSSEDKMRKHLLDVPEHKSYKWGKCRRGLTADQKANSVVGHHMEKVNCQQ